MENSTFRVALYLRKDTEAHYSETIPKVASLTEVYDVLPDMVEDGFLMLDDAAVAAQDKKLEAKLLIELISDIVSFTAEDIEKIITITSIIADSYTGRALGSIEQTNSEGKTRLVIKL